MDEARAVASQFLFAEPVIWLQGAGLTPDWLGGHLLRAPLFPREGGDPDWAPAFAGEQGGEDHRQPNTTPAEAGAQLGDDANCAQFFVTATFPTGPRPPPGWRYCGVGA